MNPANRKRVVRAIHELVPEMHVKGSILVAKPRGSVLRGFFVENSSDPNGVYVWTFVQPLYVPADTVVLSLGQRIRNRLWSLGDVENNKEAIHDARGFFEGIRCPEDVCEWELVNRGPDEYSQQANSFSLILSGRIQMALPILRDLAAIDGVAWRREIANRCSVLFDSVVTSPGRAVEMLASFENETANALQVADIE